MTDINANIDMMAYKLYIRENAKFEKLVDQKYWTFPNRTFGIRVTDIDNLIDEALEKGFEPNKKSLKINGGHGRAIWNHIKKPSVKNLGKPWGDEKHFEDFGQLFGCCSYYDFRSNPKFAEIKKEYHEKILQILGNPFAEQHNYILHYWNKSHVARALVEFFVSDKDENKPVNCRINYYNEKIHKYEHTVTSKTGISEDNPGAIINGDSQNTHIAINHWRPTFLTINAPAEEFIHRELLFCTYSTIHKSKLPFSGVGILQRTQDLDVNKRMPADIPPNIYHHLFRKATFITEEEQEFIDNENDLIQLDENYTLEKNEFTGVYRGFYLDNSFNHDGKVLRTLLLELEPSGKVTILDGEHVKDGTQDGFYYIDKSTGLMIIDADMDLNSGGAPRYHIIIDARLKNPHGFLEGVYGGYNKYITPFIGLIKLQKLDNTSIKNIAEEFRSTHFTKDDQKKENFRNSVTKEVTNFFEKSEFFSYPYDCLLIDPNPEYNGPKGLFYFYGRSSYGKGSLVRYCLFLHEDGRADITTKDTRDKPREGRAIAFNNGAFIIVDFFTNNNGSTNETNDPYAGTYLIHSKDMEDGLGIGISLRVNRGHNVQAKLEYIVSSKRYTEKKDDARQNASGAANDREFLFFYSNEEEYEKISTLYPRIETLFEGNYNMVIEKDMLTGADDISKRVVFDKVFFHHALLVYLKTEDLSKNSEAYKYFTLAMEHGLFLVGRFDRWFEEFYVLDAGRIAGMKEKFKTLFDELKGEFRSKK